MTLGESALHAHPRNKPPITRLVTLQEYEDIYSHLPSCRVLRRDYIREYILIQYYTDKEMNNKLEEKEK